MWGIILLKVLLTLSWAISLDCNLFYYYELSKYLYTVFSYNLSIIFQ